MKRILIRFFFGTFIGRTIVRFVSGFVSVFLFLFLGCLLGAVFLLLAADALFLAWAAVDGILYLASNDPRMKHQSLMWLIAGCIAMGVIVVVFGMIYDAFCGARARLVRRRATRMHLQQLPG